MRFQFGLIGALILASACSGDGAGPRTDKSEHGGGTGHSITGQVVAIAFTPESSYVGVPGVQVVLMKLSSDSGSDTTVMEPTTPGRLRPPSPPPIDTSWTDTIPNDTTWHPPVDSIPLDTIPIDSVSHPTYCGGGVQVATTTTDASGHFSFSGLGAGEYDVVVPAQDGWLSNLYCRADIRTRDSVDVRIPLFTGYAAPAAARHSTK